MHGLALRINEYTTEIYIGSGMNGDNTWTSSVNSPVNDYLLKVTYEKNEYGYVEVEATCDLRNNVCGICGDFNGAPDFRPATRMDRRSWERLLERKHFWGKKTFDSDDEKCPYTNSEGNRVPTEALAQTRKKRQADQNTCPNLNTIRSECENAMNDAVFASCTLSKEQAINNCVFDSCATGETGSFICNMLSEYVSRCNASPDTSNRIEVWRSQNRCPPVCPPNSRYYSCTANSCHKSTASCTVDDMECENELFSTCIEGCFCEDGYIHNGSECVIDDGNQCQEEQNALASAEAVSSQPCLGNPCENDGSCRATNTGEYTCECRRGFTGANCENIIYQNFNTQIESTSEVLSRLIATDTRLDISVDEFLSHGCFCSRLDNSAGHRGKAVSELDQVCRQLMHCDKCKVRNECSGERGYPFFVKPGALVCNHKLNSPCQQAQCECSISAATQIIEYVRGNNIDSIEERICEETPNAGKNFECCGSGNYWMLYNRELPITCDTSGNYPVLKDSTTLLVRNKYPGIR